MRDGWVEMTLGDIVNLEYGRALKESDRRGGDVPVFGSAGIVGWHDEPLVDQAPTIIVGRKGTAGTVHWSDAAAWPIDTAYWVRLKQDADPRFLYLLLTHVDLASISAQTGVPGLNRDRAAEIRVAVPPLIEQRRIVHVVDAIHAAERQAEYVTSAVRRLRHDVATTLLSGAHEIPDSYDAHLAEAASA